MFVFGHAGITLAAAVLLDRALSMMHRSVTEPDDPGNPVSPSPAQGSDMPAGSPSSLFQSLGRHIDIRVLILASLLPDIIDKPIGRVIFRETFENGRIFAHTLVFLLVVTVVGFCIPAKNRMRIGMAVAFGVLTHLVLDAMWRTPETLLWPLYGWSFGKYPSDLYSWAGIQEAIEKVIAHPILALPEVLGVVVMLWLIYELIRRRRLYDFLRQGMV